MQKAFKMFFAISITAILLLLIILHTPVSKHLLLPIISRITNLRINANQCNFSFRKGLNLSQVSIRNHKDMQCLIKNCDIKLISGSLINGQYSYQYNFNDIHFSYPSSKVVAAIINALGLNPDFLFEFNAITGELYISNDGTIVKGFKATGEDLTIFADGITSRDQVIDYSFRLLISDKMISKIPDGLSALFFKKDQDQHEVKLSLSGSTSKPSINFSSSLFKLRIK